MSSGGTLLSDLDGKATAPEDQQFVRRILEEINQVPGSANQVMYPGGGGGGGGSFASGSGQIINSPNPNTTAPIAMDPNTATAHMIGKDAPSPGDFARMMYGGGGVPPMMGGGGPAPQMAPIAGMPMAMAMGSPYQTPMTIPMPQLLPAPQSQGWFSGIFKDFGSQFRLPLLVAIVIFVMSLPAINVLIAHYIPYLIRPSGEISMSGQAAKALTGGILFWIVYKVIIPLGSGAM